MPLQLCCQLSCHNMCKIPTWFGRYNHIKAKTIFTRFQLWAHNPFVKWGPGSYEGLVNTLRPRQIRRHFADDSFKCIFLNENVLISIKISLNCIPKGLINNIPALVQIMAWCWPGDKPLSEPMTVNLLMHVCVTRPQWVKDKYETEYSGLALEHIDILKDTEHISI